MAKDAMYDRLSEEGIESMHVGPFSPKKEEENP